MTSTNINEQLYELKKSCINGDIDKVKQILQKNNYKFNIYGKHNSIFATAINSKNIELIKYLITYDDNIYKINFQLINEFEYICKTHNFELFLFLLKICKVYYDSNVYEYTLLDLLNSSCRLKNIRIAKYLFEHLTTTNIQLFTHKSKYHEHNMSEIFQSACENGNIQFIKYLVNHAEIYNYMHYILYGKSYDIFETACLYGHIDIIKLIFELNKKYRYNINIHEHKDRAFSIACQNGHFKTVKFLINYGIDNCSRFEIYNSFSSYFLYLCTTQSDSKLIKLILDYSISIGSIIRLNSFDLYKIFNALCYNKYIDNLIELIKYCELTNNKIYFNIEQVDIRISLHETITLKYILYLINHNYSSLCILKYNIINNIIYTYITQSLYNSLSLTNIKNINNINKVQHVSCMSNIKLLLNNNIVNTYIDNTKKKFINNFKCHHKSNKEYNDYIINYCVFVDIGYVNVKIYKKYTKYKKYKNHILK